MFLLELRNGNWNIILCCFYLGIKFSLLFLILFYCAMKKYWNKIYVENKQYFIFVKLDYKNCININNDYCTNHSSGNPEIPEHSNHIGGVMVSVLASSVVDRGFIGDVMVSVLASSVVDRGFIGDVMVSVLASSVVDRGFWSGQTKNYKIIICCFSAKYVWLRSKIKDWLVRNQNNVFE